MCITTIRFELPTNSFEGDEEIELPNRNRRKDRQRDHCNSKTLSIFCSVIHWQTFRIKTIELMGRRVTTDRSVVDENDRADVQILDGKQTETSRLLPFFAVQFRKTTDGTRKGRYTRSPDVESGFSKELV